MNEWRAISIVAFCLAWHHSACVFFYEKSDTILKPNSPDELKFSDFGFSLGYHRERLVVGEPRSSESGFGAIYYCEVDPNICRKKNFDVTTTNITYELNPKQNFYLGGTIAAGENYVFTCAPLVTQLLFNSNENATDAFGTCFIYYDNGTTCEYNGPAQKFLENESKDQVVGGTGWNSLADKNNDLLLVAKTSLQVNIMYGSLKNPEKQFKFAVPAIDRWQRVSNVGYGLAAGNFFSTQTVYAVSKQFFEMNGQIVFFELKGRKDKTLRLYRRRNGGAYYRISGEKLNTMFGYALGAADLNMDGYSDLLVGAPAHSDDDDKVESGALLIYSSLQSRLKKFFVFADAERGRFGTTLATSDMDSDRIPEVFVSAPYEGSGAVYVLSGRELKDGIKSATFSDNTVKVMLSALKRTQRIVRKDLSLFGFSLLVIPDFDKNGHSDLAIGAPASSSVLVLKSYQTIEVNITSEIDGSLPFITVEQNEFDVKVCIYIYNNDLAALASGRLIVKNTFNTDKAFIKEPDFLTDKKEHCKKIHVKFQEQGPGAYKFETNVAMDTEFDNRVAISPKCVPTKVLVVNRRCIDGDCRTKPTLDNIHSRFDDEGTYALGSSDKEQLTVIVKNDNEHFVYGARVKFEVSGATITKMSCSDDISLHCVLPKFRKTFEINMDLNMKGRKNTEKELIVVAKLYEDYDESTVTDTKILNITYLLSEQQKLLVLETTPRQDLNITDRDFADGNTEFILSTHKYRIINLGTIFWDTPISIMVENGNMLIEKVTTTVVEHCSDKNVPTKFERHCNVIVKPGETKWITVSIFMSKNKLGKQYTSNLSTKSEVSVQTTTSPTEYKRAKYESKITMISEQFHNSKYKMIIIGVVLALLVIMLIGFILWKKGFFKRKERKRFDETRESMRKRSIRLASESRLSVRSSQKASVTGGNGLPHVQEEDDDAVFIIEEEVHSERAVN